VGKGIAYPFLMRRWRSRTASVWCLGPKLAGLAIMLRCTDRGLFVTNNEDILQRASELLEKFRIAEIFVALLEEQFRFESTSSVEFTRYLSTVEVNDDLKKSVTLTCDGHEIVLGFTDFRGSYAPDDASSYAEAYAYYDEGLVLHTTATKDYTDYGSIIKVMIYPLSLKAFKAGPWLELLGRCYDELVEASKKKNEDTRQKEMAEQVSNIDLGDYE